MNLYKFYKNKILLLISSFVFLAGCSTFSSPQYKGPVTDHFDGNKFYNLDKDSNNSSGSLFGFFLKMIVGDYNDWYKMPVPESPKPVPFIDKNLIRATYVGHATVLLQFDSLNILTDPVWSETVGPGTLFDPHRIREPGIKFEDLPNIDIVVLSHNHYDHTDIPTLKRLMTAFHPLFLVQLGNKALLVDNGITNVIDLDWWQSEEYKGIKVYSVPSRHTSMRGLDDIRTSLWGGYVFLSKGGPVYFAGDTGFGSHFKLINEKFGAPILSLLPLGPIHPREFMKKVHIDAVEAVEAHSILKSEYSLGIHFGTFNQGADEMDEPVTQLKDELKKYNISTNIFNILIPGHFLDIKYITK